MLNLSGKDSELISIPNDYKLKSDNLYNYSRMKGKG